MKMRLACAVFAFVVAGCFDCESCGSSDKDKSESASAAAATGSGEVIVLDVQEMSCEQGCARRVETILAEFPGVEKASVNFAEKMASITPKAGTQLDMDGLVKALKDAGYPTSIHSEG